MTTVNNHKKYTSFGSDFISITFDKTNGKLAFLGIDSGGRDRDRHASFNLMLPSYGATVGAFKKKLPIAEKMIKTEDTLSFENENGSVSLTRILNDKSFDWTFVKPIKNDILNMRFCIKTAPVTIWSDSVTGRKAPSQIKTKDPLVVSKTRYTLPIIIHFPDFGHLKIESLTPDIYCEEELRKSDEFSGIALGYLNYDECHNDMNAVHYGSSSITFKSKKDTENVKLRFTVLDEIYPDLPFADKDSHDWDGLRRCWMNSFALNRWQFSMGDNIMLTGVGHLSVGMKSDILQVMNGENESFRMVRKVFERQILEGFLKTQAEDGEVNFSYYGTKKPDNIPMCAFIDSTPGSIISTAGISHWNLPFAKKLIPYAMKAADFLISLDKDKDGIIEVPFSGNSMEEREKSGEIQRNWWDNFAFGHKDIYFNCLCHRAFRELSELLCRVNMKEEAKKYLLQLEKFDANFYKTFYNPKTGVMAGWISRDGRMHDYMFTFATSMSIDEGLVSNEDGKKMLKILLKQMEKDGYGDLRYGIPGNTIPVEPEDTIYWPCMSDWGKYENGGLSGMNGFHFITSMYKVGLRKEADKILKTILNTYEKEFTHSGLMPGYTESVDWRTKEGVRCGYNYLADNYYFLLSAYTGRGNVKHPAVVK